MHTTRRLNRPRPQQEAVIAISTRQLALNLLEDVEASPQHFDEIVDRGLERSNFDHRDRRLVYELVSGIIRRRVTLDYYIRHFLEDKSYTGDPMLMRVLRLGAYQIVCMDRIPDHAAVNETVTSARRFSSTRYATGLINAVLRAIIAHKQKLPLPDPKDVLQRFAVEFSFPEWMVKRWLDRLGMSKTRRLLGFFNERPDLFIRRKVRGFSRQQFEIDNRLTIEGTATGFMSLYYRVSKEAHLRFLDALKEGDCMVQNPSSGWVVALLEVQNGDRILDLCSAPGGKTTLMAELCGSTGRICAADISFVRLLKVRDNARLLDIRTIFPLVMDGFRSPIAGTFDKVLLDAPCSGSGVMHRHPEARWIKSADDLTRITAYQKRLLHGAAALVAPGGLLVYSTCSIEPEENELQIEEFLRDHPAFSVESTPFEIPATFVDAKNYLCILPYEHNLDGMFAARLRKKPA